MKESYKYGEIILALREEYNECKKILDELKNNIYIKTDYDDFYFYGLLSSCMIKGIDKKVGLYIEKEYPNFFKKMQILKYNWYEDFLYALFNVVKNSKGLYELKYDEVPFYKRKYIPEVEINDKEKFSKLVDNLLSTDLMNTKTGDFQNNDYVMFLRFDNASIFSNFELPFEASICWDGKTDIFSYIFDKKNDLSLIGDILSLKMPSSSISEDWLKILEKHSAFLNSDFIFDLDKDIKSKNGDLFIPNIQDDNDKKIIKLKKIYN